ncbi:hypothetical protein [Oryzifoliimicrobium ureilyticus]|uniref:hypothetical protein n=1 Tax=Oryzifoliimicrobium ureilyticus TaxID=3113724 RepID=UPI003075F97B
MAESFKYVLLIALSGIFFGSSFAPVYAFRMPPVEESQDGLQQRAVSAFSGDQQQGGSQDGSMLSANEVKHIQWCAARYTFSYDPVLDVYTNERGKSFKCISPR